MEVPDIASAGFSCGWGSVQPTRVAQAPLGSRTVADMKQIMITKLLSSIVYSSFLSDMSLFSPFYYCQGAGMNTRFEIINHPQLLLGVSTLAKGGDPPTGITSAPTSDIRSASGGCTRGRKPFNSNALIDST